MFIKLYKIYLVTCLNQCLLNYQLELPWPRREVLWNCLQSKMKLQKTQAYTDWLIFIHSSGGTVAPRHIGVSRLLVLKNDQLFIMRASQAPLLLLPLAAGIWESWLRSNGQQSDHGSRAPDKSWLGRVGSDCRACEALPFFVCVWGCATGFWKRAPK